MLGVTTEGDLVKIDLAQYRPRRAMCFILLQANDSLADVPQDVINRLWPSVRTEHRGLDVYCQGVLQIYLQHYRDRYHYSKLQGFQKIIYTPRYVWQCSRRFWESMKTEYLCKPVCPSCLQTHEIGMRR